jgi:hypothetical protein
VPTRKPRPGSATREEMAAARLEVRSAWSRAVNETRGAANMSGGHSPAEVEALARDVCERALSALSIEARERVARTLAIRYIPAAANSPHMATVRSRAAGSSGE